MEVPPGTTVVYLTSQLVEKISVMGVTSGLSHLRTHVVTSSMAGNSSTAGKGKSIPWDCAIKT